MRASLAIFSAALVLLLSACAGLPPADPVALRVAPQAADFVAAAGQGTGVWPQAQWWQDFQDAQLNRLIEQGLSSSPSMALAQARIQQAASDSRIIQAQAGVSLAANAQATRQLYSQNSIYPAPLGGNYDNSALLHLDFSYDFDFWGRNRKALEAALGKQRAAEAERAAAANTLASAIAVSYFQWQFTQQKIALNQQTSAARQQLATLAQQKIKAGISPADDLHPLQADLSIPEQTATQLQTQSHQLLSQINALLGLGHNTADLQAHTLPALPPSVPAGLTLDLLAHRPDVAAAAARTQAALASVDSARAAFYPDISISAFVGLNSLEFSRLLHSNSLEQGITPALHLPLFDAGRLRAALDSQRSNALAAGAEYDQSVTNAVHEVNDALLRLQGHLDEGRALQHQLQARTHSAANLSLRRQAGLSSGTEQLRSQLAVLDTRRQIIDQQQTVMDARLDLIKALGGGYAASQQPQ